MTHESKLNVIIPFKSTTSSELYTTISPLLHQCNVRVNILLIYDQACADIAKEVVNRCILGSEISPEHSLLIYPAKSKGIYTSINQALSLIQTGELYIVLGAGDVLSITSPVDIESTNNISLIPYVLSKNSTVIYSEPRNIYSGMPYCHNAIIFAKNHLKYDTYYTISADYKYLLQYLSYENSSLDALKVFPADRIQVSYDNYSGISKKSFLKKNCQNIKILMKLSLVSLLIYICFLAVKSLRKIPSL